MGGSIGSSLFTAQELSSFEKVKALQAIALRFVSQNLFYGIPVRSGKKAPHDPIGMIWIEPLPEVLENPSRSMDVTENLLYGIPTGVAVDSKGRIRILFADNNVEYLIPADVVSSLDQFRYPGFEIPIPQPPQLLDRSTHSIGLQWKESLPYPVGVITAVEIQFLSVKISSQSANETHIGGAWNSLVTKLYSHSQFTCFTMDYLRPGKVYYFRMRYRCPAGWSEFSPSSEKITTEPEVPIAPDAPIISSISSFAAIISWKEPSADNGSAIVQYILEGKSTGDSFSTIFSGMDLSYLVLGLYPEFSYSFRVAAVNGVGTSEFSKISSFHSPSLSQIYGRSKVATNNEIAAPCVPGFSDQQVNMAVGCVQAWQQHWDPLTEQPFYFNTVLGIRQLETPSVLAEMYNPETTRGSLSSSVENVISYPRSMYGSFGKTKSNNSASTEEFIKSFRKKRYRLVRSLHNRKRSVFGNCNSDVHTRSRLTMGDSVAAVNGSVLKSNDCLFLRLRRSKLLQDFCAQLAPYRQSATSKHDSKCVELLKRFKVQFIGEEGIDAGGLVKEAFLLLSKEFIRYGLNPSKQFIRQIDETAVSHENLFRSDEEDQTKTCISKVSGGIFISDQYLRTVEEVENECQHILPETDLSRTDFGYWFGLFLGKAIMDRQLVEVPLSMPLLQHLLGNYEFLRSKNITPNSQLSIAEVTSLVKNDVSKVDPTLAKSLNWMLENNNITDVVEETFSVTYGSVNIPLCARGESTDVTDHNKLAYVYLISIWKLIFSLADILDSFLEGFYNVVPLASLRDAGINPDELFMMLNGKDAIDVDELRAYVLYEGDKDTFHECCTSIVWLWRFVREIDEEIQRKFLLFFTGSSRVPLDGYDPPLTITDGVDMPIDSLPKAHTCFNQLVLPRYSNYDTLKEKIMYAVNNTEGFGMI